MHPETLAIHAGHDHDPHTRAVAVPIYQTVAYAFDDARHGAALFNLAEAGNIYTRIMNPTCAVLEQRVAALEGGTGALAVSAGSAAIFYAAANIARAGQNIVSVPQLYGGTYTLFAHMLPRFGIEVRFAARTTGRSRWRRWRTRTRGPSFAKASAIPPGMSPISRRWRRRRIRPGFR